MSNDIHLSLIPEYKCKVTSCLTLLQRLLSRHELYPQSMNQNKSFLMLTFVRNFVINKLGEAVRKIMNTSERSV